MQNCSTLFLSVELFQLVLIKLLNYKMLGDSLLAFQVTSLISVRFCSNDSGAKPVCFTKLTFQVVNNPTWLKGMIIFVMQHLITL